MINPVLILPNREMAERVSAYAYVWDAKNAALAMGLGSFINHSYAPNAYYERYVPMQSMKFIALHDIKPGEEIFINYNGDPKDESPLWFKVK